MGNEKGLLTLETRSFILISQETFISLLNPKRETIPGSHKALYDMLVKTGIVDETALVLVAARLNELEKEVQELRGKA